MWEKYKRKTQRRTLDSILGLLILLISLNANSQINCDYEIYSNTSAITNNTFQAGDTLCLMAGERGSLYLKNIIGTEENPIVLINKGGQCIIDSDLSYGLKFAGSKHVVISGTGDEQNNYGIYIREVTNGFGVDIGTLSTNFEVENLEIGHASIVGIIAKTDPNCTFDADRSNFTMYNIKIHDNYIHDIGNEGMYIGSSFYLGQYISACDKTFLPHIIDGVEIYNNRVEYTGWDGIQVGSALYNCSIHDNQIYKDSQAEVSYQMSGIIINTGSSCNVYNNSIIDGKGTGILNQGTGGQYFYNNLIINAGRDYDFEDQTLKQQFGIFSKYSYILPPDSSFYFYNNTIINPKSDGIRFMNAHSENNRFINNIIINPGAYDFYKNLGSVNYEASDAYIHNYLDAADIFLLNNIFERSSKDQFFADTLNYDYHLSSNSPAVNTGYDLTSSGITFDLDNYTRPFENYFDIGAYEFQTITALKSPLSTDQKLLITPNPGTDHLNLSFQLDKDQLLNLKFVSMDGKVFTLFKSLPFLKGKNTKEISISHLPKAKYILVLYNEKTHVTQKFQKL